MVRGHVTADFGIVPVDANPPVVVGDGKPQSLAMNLRDLTGLAIQFDHGTQGNGHAVRVGAVGDVERFLAKLHLGREEGEQHSVAGASALNREGDERQSASHLCSLTPRHQTTVGPA